MLSEEGKLPFVLQVVAMEAFKKGTLVLSPASGEVVQSKCIESPSASAPSQGIIHASMLSTVHATIYSGMKDRRKKEATESGKTAHFVIRSPLLDGKKVKCRQSCMENLVPFWAVLRCFGPRCSHNMELEDITFSADGFEPKAGKFPKSLKNMQVTVDLPILRNVSNIAKGDVLVLPFFDQ